MFGRINRLIWKLHVSARIKGIRSARRDYIYERDIANDIYFQLMRLFVIDRLTKSIFPRIFYRFFPLIFLDLRMDL